MYQDFPLPPLGNLHPAHAIGTLPTKNRGAYFASGSYVFKNGRFGLIGSKYSYWLRTGSYRLRTSVVSNLLC